MTYRAYTRSTAKPTQRQKANDRQVANNAGGYVFALDKWKTLDRFLILGSEGGTFYVGEQTLTRQNARVVDACLAEDYRRTVDTIVAVSEANRAPKTDPAIFALSIAASHTDLNTRSYALSVLPRVCRIPTHLFHFIEFVKGQRGWGRGLRNAIANWYTSMTPDKLGYELVKYQSRDGWSNRDVLRKSHPQTSNSAQNAVFRWAVGADTNSRIVIGRDGERRYPATVDLPAIIVGFEKAKSASKRELVKLIHEYGLTREMVPTEMLKEKDVWEALLVKMPAVALVRNLATMTKVGLIKDLSEGTKLAVSKLDKLTGAKIHPLSVLNALKTYSSGRGFKGNATWTPVRAIIDALDEAFYATFGNVQPTGKNIMLALDISGSMGYSTIAGMNITPREATAALAMITARVEKNYIIKGFHNSLIDLKISPRQRLDDVVKYIDRLGFGSTDCAQPMLYAQAHSLPVDAFVIYTDNETWSGRVQPVDALKVYRRSSGKSQARLIVNGMTATRFTIADPTDPFSLDVVGFDTATPELMSGFISGAF